MLGVSSNIYRDMKSGIFCVEKKSKKTKNGLGISENGESVYKLDDKFNG